MSNNNQREVISYLVSLVDSLEELQKENRKSYSKYHMIEKDLETLNDMLNRYSF